MPIVRLSDAGMADKIAEYVHYGVLRTHRGFHHYQRLQKTGQWQPQPDIHAADYRVGILGYGVIGRCVAHRLHAAGYQVSAFKRSANTTEESFPVLTGNSEHFLSQLNVLVCILPLTAETSGMINTELLAQLPAGAHFINVGRGDQVVEDDLLKALDSGQLGSALLDVCATEPLPEHHALWSHEGVTITPHIAGPTQVTQSVDQVAESIARLESGATTADLSGLVDNSFGY